MRKLVIAADNIRSRSLKLLAAKLSERLGYRVWRVKPSEVRLRTPVSFLCGIDIINQFLMFERGEVSCPDYRLSMNFFHQPPDWKKVVVRHITNSSEGQGIEIVQNAIDMVPQAPLYTQYIPKKKEFRVHVWNNEVIDIQQKRKKEGVDHNPQVRNVANGYVFCRSDLVEPDGIRQLALDAVNCLGRSYGAVDIIWNEKMNKCFVLEVNSRPGMEGTTLDIYVNAILAQHGLRGANL